MRSVPRSDGTHPEEFLRSQSGVYFKSVTVRKPDYVWLQSVMFSNLVAAARSEPDTYGPLLHKVLHGARRLLGFESQNPRLRSRTHPRQRQRQVLRRQRLAGDHVPRSLRDEPRPALPQAGGRDAQIRAERLGRGERRRNLVASKAQGRHQERLRQRAGGGGLPAAGEIPRGTTPRRSSIRPARSSSGRSALYRRTTACLTTARSSPAARSSAAN